MTRPAGQSPSKAVGRDTIQRIFEVVRVRRMMEAQSGGAKITNEKLIQYYSEQIQLSSESEPVAKTFIETATAVYNAMLKDAGNLAILQSMSERFGFQGPLNSIHKLQALMTKCDKDPASHRYAR